MPSLFPVRAERLAALRAEVRMIESASATRRRDTLPFGIEAIDSRLDGGGLAASCLHEVTGAAPGLSDDAAACLFVAGIANAIVWQRVFDAHRRIIMSAAMIGVSGTVQREGAVIHIITDRIDDLTPLLRMVGSMDFPHRTGRGDGAKHAGGPDRGEPGWKQSRPALSWPGGNREDDLRQKTRDFH